jgi:hypothetical protein
MPRIADVPDPTVLSAHPMVVERAPGSVAHVKAELLRLFGFEDIPVLGRFY